MATVFSTVLVLILMAGLLAYAASSAKYEQRISANELRQKRAFHGAEAALRMASEWLLANNRLIDANVEDMLGAGIDGWFVAGSERWTLCADVDYSGDKSHPCWGDPIDERRDDNFFYDFNGSTELPIDATQFLGIGDARVSVQALLCLVHIDPDIDPALSSPIKGCNTDPALADGSKFLITLLARGEADCDSGVCRSETLISEQVSNFSVVAFAKGPGVPLVTRSSFPPSGTAEVVPNPNGGGLGVPISVWANANSACVGHTPVDPSSGSWATCEAQEWYGVYEIPEGVACTEATCSCSTDEALSTTLGVTDVIGPDIVVDDAFPCDLFQFYFGVARDNYEVVKNSITVIDDCSSLDASSHGAYWVTGSTCEISANQVVGSPDNPVLLISAATLTRFNGGAELYGMLFMTDVEDSTAELRSTGNATVYGSVVADGTLGHFTGTYQVIYNESVFADASAAGGLGSITGAWSDFHKEWD